VRELIAGADDEGVEGVARVQLRGAIPIEARLRGELSRRAAESPPLWRTAVAAGSSSGVTNFNVVELEAEIVDGFLDEVGILVAGVTELNGGNANE
jgi:hypothetical protein